MDQPNQKQASMKSESSASDMFAFFYGEFESLRAKTGIRQWDQLNEQPDAAKAIHDHIDLMVQECLRPPFHVVRPDVKQRVISRAILEDEDFIGLNAKFVRKALNAWWAINKDRVMEAINKAEEIKPVELTAEQKRKIDELANAYVAKLLQGDGPKIVPKMDSQVAAVEGAEWKSSLERKAISYPVTTLQQAQEAELHREWARQNFDPRTMDKLPNWKPENEWLSLLTEDEKRGIYSRAGLASKVEAVKKLIKKK